MVEYFSPTSRQTARLRCLQETLDAMMEKRPVPESLGYIPAFEFFEIPEASSISSRSSAVGSGGFHLFEEPNTFSKMFARKFYLPGTLFMCSRRLGVDRGNGSGSELTWLEIIGVWRKNKSCPKRFAKPRYLCWRSESSSSRPSSESENVCLKNDHIRPLRSNVITRCEKRLGEAAGCRYIFDRWEDVVELTYGVTIAKESLLNCITESDTERVSAMRVPPSSDWDHRHDEALVQFLVEGGQAVDDKGGRASDVWAHVDKIELSSSVEHMTDAISALTDDNPNTYWESDGSQSSHYIRLHMKNNTVVEKIYLTIDVSDDSYLPQKVCVLACDKKQCTTSEMVKLNEIAELETEYTGDVCIYEAAEGSTRSYSVLEIQIVECKDEGIDTRIHGLKIKTRQEVDPSDLDATIDEKRLQKYPVLLYSAVTIQAIKWRALVLKRSAILMDSVLHFLVPKSELIGSVTSHIDHGVRNGDEFAPFSEILKKVRFLLPLSHKRQLLFEQLLRDTECRNFESCPQLFINRQLGQEYGPGWEATVFHQVYKGLKVAAYRDAIVLNYRWSLKHEQWWECKFIGEGVIDQGGGFRDSLCDIAEELCPPDYNSQMVLPYFVRAPNQHEDEHNRDAFVVNPSCTDFDGLQWIGKLLGACLRTKEHLILPLTKFTWKQILDQSLCWSEDFVTVDRRLVRLTEKIQSMQREEFDQYFGLKNGDSNATSMTAILSNGDVVELVPNGANVPLSFENKQEYVERLKKCRLSEGAEQIKALRQGLLKVIPESCLRLLTWFELERRISGNPEVSLDGLKKAARFEELQGDEKRVQFLWEALEHFTNEERSRFLRFVTGRRRLPTPLYICTDKGDSLLGDAEKHQLPESSTCSNTLFLPDYPSAKTCEEKLRYAIYNCLAIDTDMSPWEE